MLRTMKAMAGHLPRQRNFDVITTPVEVVIDTEHPRAFPRAFFIWSNREHRNVGLALRTSEMVHYGRADSVIDQGRGVLISALCGPPGTVDWPPAPAPTDRLHQPSSHRPRILSRITSLPTPWALTPSDQLTKRLPVHPYVGTLESALEPNRPKRSTCSYYLKGL